MPKYMTIPERTYFYDVITWDGRNLVDLEKFIEERGGDPGVALARRNDGMMMVFSDGAYRPLTVGSLLVWNEGGSLSCAEASFLANKILVSNELKGQMQEREPLALKVTR